ncbi:hypothetical protein GS913_18580 [Rhodococcus hoagii]|nr:hypothetical protein [Prescottella equi]NKT41778.1 hypothetical protein [Prescottella equi]NKT51064.1 hypothetical protein [Prescottella equi]NKV21538.1 hypothetical protein [Prescottella equi]
MSAAYVRLRDSLRSWAKSSREGFTPEALTRILTDAEITFTDTQLAAAAIEFQRCPFYGGTYTHDAQRILRAMNKEAA